MDNIYDRFPMPADADAEQEQMPDPIRDPIQDPRPERDFPAVVPERSDLPRRPVSPDEFDFIPRQTDEF